MIISTEFVKDLGLMCDSLQELPEISLELQKREINLYKAYHKIKTLVQVTMRGEIHQACTPEAQFQPVKKVYSKGLLCYKSNHVSILVFLFKIKSID
ncbi:hypothetical protein ENBRE01_3158 [Enteropsectra breve]|nr:hypothetical protein ENBRE01_3158 [Enteropsectra breve]